MNKKERILASLNRLLADEKITQEQYDSVAVHASEADIITAIKDRAIQEVQDELNL